tara:strand:- start:559 stop:681 length:123 start_codon:yes stop_codon:yes gene_type:complete
MNKNVPFKNKILSKAAVRYFVWNLEYLKRLVSLAEESMTN